MVLNLLTHSSTSSIHFCDTWSVYPIHRHFLYPDCVGLTAFGYVRTQLKLILGPNKGQGGFSEDINYDRKIK